MTGYPQKTATSIDTLVFRGDKTYRHLGDVDKETILINLYPDSTCLITTSTKRNKQNTIRNSYAGYYSINGKELIITTNPLLPAYNGKYLLYPNHMILKWKVKSSKPVIKVQQPDGFRMKIRGSKPIRRFHNVVN